MMRACRLIKAPFAEKDNGFLLWFHSLIVFNGSDFAPIKFVPMSQNLTSCICNLEQFFSVATLPSAGELVFMLRQLLYLANANATIGALDREETVAL